MNERRSQGMTIGAWTAIGIGVGVALGVAMNNIPVWLAIGAALGLAIGAATTRNRSGDS